MSASAGGQRAEVPCYCRLPGPMLFSDVSQFMRHLSLLWCADNQRISTLPICFQRWLKTAWYWISANALGTPQMGHPICKDALMSSVPKRCYARVPTIICLHYWMMLLFLLMKEGWVCVRVRTSDTQPTDWFRNCRSRKKKKVSRKRRKKKLIRPGETDHAGAVTSPERTFEITA